MDDKGFPPRLAQAGANLETRYSVTPRSLFFFAFHFGLPKWERIWSARHTDKTLLPVRQAQQRLIFNNNQKDRLIKRFGTLISTNFR